MTRIFISYRRDDSADVSGRIYDRLAEHFGDEIVFKDVDDIPFGVDYKTYLTNVVATCAVELVVIGRDWLNATDGVSQRRRLDDPADFVRIEIQAALDLDIPVVPLLVRGASMPQDDALPPVLSRLAFRNGTAIRPDPDFHNDMTRLIKGLEQYVEPTASTASRAKTAPPKTPPQVPPTPPKERVLYEKGGDRVTTYAARLADKTFAIADIRAASTGKRKPNPNELGVRTRPEKFRRWATGAAIALFVAAFAVGIAYEGSALAYPLFVLAAVVFGIAWLGTAYAEIDKATQRRHTVNVIDASGEKEILASRDKVHVARVAKAINEARAQLR